jgi:hypothetical protein
MQLTFYPLAILSCWILTLASADCFLSTSDSQSARRIVFYVMSDLSNFATPKGGNTMQAVAAANPGWTATVPGATWIWTTNPADTDVVFSAWFSLPGCPVSAKLYLAADDNVQTYINGVTASCYLTGAYTPSGQGVCDVTSYLKTGNNHLEFWVVNLGGPAGLIYNLVVTTNI